MYIHRLKYQNSSFSSRLQPCGNIQENVANATQNNDTYDSNEACTESEERTSQLRRSSFVVIPAMQVCPGDLLVYSKALTHQNTFTGI